MLAWCRKLDTLEHIVSGLISCAVQISDSYRNSGNFYCHVIFIAIKKNNTKIRNLKMHFYIRFRLKLIKNHENYKYKKILNGNFLIYGKRLPCTVTCY